MKRDKKSFIGFCVFYFSIYSCILLLSIIFLNILIESKLKMVIPTMDDLLEYEDYLIDDDFNKLPLNKFSKNEILIFDETNSPIFSTNNYPEFSIGSWELDYINDYYSDYFYTIKKFVTGEGEEYYYISKNLYTSKDEYETVVDYAILNENLEIVEGEAFPGRKKLSECELELINGYAGDNSFIEKYSYETSEGKKRTLVFLEAPMDMYKYEEKVGHIYSLWLYLIPVIAVFELIITYFFFQKIRKMIVPLQEVMDNYENIPKFSEEDVPWEFRSLFHSFKKLISRLNDEKNRNDAIYREKQSIIANISHDLKTPLTVIKGYAKALKDGIVPDNKKKKYIDAIYNKAEISTNIIDSLFEYTRMEHPDFKSNFERLDFNEFCREYLAIKYTDLELQGYRLEFQLLTKKMFKSFDPKLVTRLFDNIINNSIKHNEKGITIYFKLVKRGDKVKIILADNGQGIDKKIEKTLFSAFVIGDESRNNGSGTGLGLFIAKRVVEIHEGTIKLVEKPKDPYKFEIEIIF